MNIRILRIDIIDKTKIREATAPLMKVHTKQDILSTCESAAVPYFLFFPDSENDDLQHTLSYLSQILMESVNHLPLVFTDILT